MSEAVSKNKIQRELFSKVLREIPAKYPKTFFGSGSTETRALKIGISIDLQKENPDFPPWMVRIFLKRYTAKNRYLWSLIAGGFRVDLCGNDASEILEQHSRRALNELTERQKAKVAA